jgi:hypothetical protein
MNLALKTAMASALVLASAATASAQSYYGTPYRPTDQYMQQQRDYDAQRQAYLNSRADYRAARADYDRQVADWQARRAEYDARYGEGAYVRLYGPAPTWDMTRWAYVTPPAGWYATSPAPGYAAPSYAYVAPPTGYAAPAAGYYGAPTAYAAPAPVACNNNAAITAGLIGAIAGGVLGSNISHHDKTTGTVLGALVGGGAGAAIGHAHDAQKCDEHGPYYSYSDTVPYRVSNDVYPDTRYAQWQSQGCRLAPAPVSQDEYRYVRVCPDDTGRYRVTG